MNTIVVAAAVIERAGRFLVTRRQPGTHLAGTWEFPGGKCEPGETIAECLARELREELALEGRVADTICTVTHEYPDRRVELHFLRCEADGDPTPVLGQQMRWVPRDGLGELEFPPADAVLIRLLSKG